ncbi:ATP-binding protein [Bifidobacterium sp. ESL0704]|uniref:ATP-binding protein n=1 Tax=Bifidobacterium sp. ESL0704 TaxID=2983219 RepID=UPI0023F94A85|nr:ATP-binding protein [Bifidobacterium sp. ESL0704]WEV53585.1 Crp/Fnr family transcriptional regulator [Bifidobacterium sp. ESL0704]
MDTDEGMPHGAEHDGNRQVAGSFSAALPFDHRSSANQNLTFAYAKSAFASAGIEWCDASLERLHLFDAEQQTTNVALLLSEQCPYLVKCAVFEGETKAKLVQRQNVSGSLMKQIDATMMFFNRHNPENTWPETALRESLINAVLHRDYDKSGPILISVFDSSIEIVSPGGLVDGFEVNDLLNGVSESRNAWLADVFEALHLSENYGTGVQRILDAYSQSLASPQLRVGPGSVAMILPKPVLDCAWPAPQTDGENTGNAENGTRDDNDHDCATGTGRAKRYTFPLGGTHLFTTRPAEALTGSRVLDVTPLPSVVFAGEKAWKLLNGDYGPKALDSLPDSVKTEWRAWADGQTTNQWQISALEEITMHLLSKRKTAMSLKEIQTQLGTDSGAITNALEGLTNTGKLQSITSAGTTKYSLPY